MSLRSNVGPAIVCLLLLVFGGAMAWLTGRSYVADLRSYYPAPPVPGRGFADLGGVIALDGLAQAWRMAVPVRGIGVIKRRNGVRRFRAVSIHRDRMQ